MMLKSQGVDRRFSHIRFAYLLVYFVFLTLNKFIPFQYVPHIVLSTIYSVLAIVGSALLAFDFFTKRRMFTTQGSTLLIGFFAVYAVSMILNARYGVVDNAKTLVWMLIQVFLLCSFDDARKTRSFAKETVVLGETFSWMWFVGAVWSFIQFLVQYEKSHTFADRSGCIEGFSKGRLFGVFTDPNIASLCSLIVMVFLIWRFCTMRNVLLRIFYVVNFLFQFVYFVLAASRMAQVILYAMVFFALAVMVFRNYRLHEENKKRFVCLVVVAVVILGSLPFIITAAKEGLAHVPIKVRPLGQKVEQITGEEIYQTEITDKVDVVRPDVEDNKDISNSRFTIWRDGLRLMKHVPLFGTSPRNLLAVAEEHLGKEAFIVQRQYSMHNGYLSVLVCTGIFGAVLIACWIAKMLWEICGFLIRRLRDNVVCYRPLVFITVILLAIAVSAFFIQEIFFMNSSVEFVFWYLLGLALHYVRTAEPERYRLPYVARLSNAVSESLQRKEENTV